MTVYYYHISWKDTSWLHSFNKYLSQKATYSGIYIVFVNQIKYTTTYLVTTKFNSM